MSGLWVERLALTNFRGYGQVSLATGPEPQVIAGANGAGKTNLLEALSLLAPGQGMRRAPFAEIPRASGDGGFAVAAHVHTLNGAADIGTGLNPGSVRGMRSQSDDGDGSSGRVGRIVRIDGVAQSGSGVLADYLEIVWVTPAMDGLFTGPASERRRFLDRLILCFDPAYRTIAGRFERAMTSRNRLLSDGVRDNAQLSSFERVMAETGIAVAAARLEAVSAMAAVVARRKVRDPNSAFPWSEFKLEGRIEDDIAAMPAITAEDAYARVLRETRERDRGAGRTLDGPHRSDLAVGHGPKAMPARLCSTGEQKALLLGLVLAHAELLTERQDGAAPVLLLDEITAHLDEHRRAALFAEILHLKAQAWMTGTDAAAFEALCDKARFWRVDEAQIAAL
ncbi:MAG TPA: DNA replication/repair protein RecF [Hyphomicrobium sp.]|nr:DNA replication/repair protein RecF [Hyphomicrobium sp.]